MTEIELITDQVFNIKNEFEFEALALKVFDFQFKNNKIYRSYIQFLGADVKSIKHYQDIPFLPIEFFKSHRIVSSEKDPQEIFTSSGTTGSQQSKHFVIDTKIYIRSFLEGFSRFYGELDNYCVLALLPSYLERNGSSLVYMVNELIRRSEQAESGFYLDNLDELASMIQSEKLRDKKVLLIGVSFALLDLIEKFSIRHPNLIVMETGGMKGRRKELIREELHQQLSNGLGVKSIHSEYGMTELLSQAYSLGDGVFESPPWMKILIRDTNDPLCLLENGRSGGINVIDLANIYSCSFIMTQDLGRKTNEQSFEVLGRFDSSDIRGCNLLVG
jgi:hypothetical protein